jgi:uncharacterized protein YbjQ (UPF0145 family)
MECGGCGGPIIEGSKLACPKCQTFMRVAAGKIGAFATIMQNAANAIVEKASPDIMQQHASILAEAAVIAMDFTKRTTVEVQPIIAS